MTKQHRTARSLLTVFKQRKAMFTVRSYQTCLGVNRYHLSSPPIPSFIKDSIWNLRAGTEWQFKHRFYFLCPSFRDVWVIWKKIWAMSAAAPTVSWRDWTKPKNRQVYSITDWFFNVFFLLLAWLSQQKCINFYALHPYQWYVYGQSPAWKPAPKAVLITNRCGAKHSDFFSDKKTVGPTCLDVKLLFCFMFVMVDLICLHFHCYQGRHIFSAPGK